MIVQLAGNLDIWSTEQIILTKRLSKILHILGPEDINTVIQKTSPWEAFLWCAIVCEYRSDHPQECRALENKLTLFLSQIKNN